MPTFLTDIINWILSLTISGLPVFCSDRFDLYRGGTNDVPWTFQHVSHDSESTPGTTWHYFNSPNGYVNIARDTGATWFWGVTSAMQWDGATTAYQVAETGDAAMFWNLSANAFTEPGGFRMEFVDTAGLLPNSIEMMQLEWIESSPQRGLFHFVAGFILCMCFELAIFICWPFILGCVNLLRV